MSNPQLTMSGPQRGARAGWARRVGLTLWIVGATLSGAAATGCAKARAETMAPDGPPLAMPAPPPRVLAPVEELAAVPEPPETPPETPAPAPRTPPRTPVRRPAGTDADAKQEVPPAAAPVVVPPPVVEPPRDVRPAPSAAEVALERKVRDVMARAGRDLMRIDYRGLSAQGREQYDQAKQFSEQAEQALKDRNFPYALTLAEKSATLATQLQGR